MLKLGYGQWQSDTFFGHWDLCLQVSIKKLTTLLQRNGWNTYVREKHDVARDAYCSWVAYGKPKYGYAFDCMKKTRAVFKLAVRYCKNNIEQMKADACAEGMIDNDCHKFWRNVYKISNSRATNFATCVGGCSGVEDVETTLCHTVQ